MKSILPKFIPVVAALCFACGTSAVAQTTVVERPATGTNANYVNFRAPLQSTPLIKLPVGSIKPSGWLLNYLTMQKEGLCGQLGTISSWLDKNNNQWLSDSGDHGWEEVPYWLRGYCSMAYILGDEDMIKEAQVWFDAVLNNLKADGFLGPRNYSDGKPEVWAQMIMLWALQTYYEYSGDQRVIDAMTNYMKWELALDDSQFITGYWEHLRGGDNLWSLLWLYNRTGDETLLPLVEKLHRCTADWTQTSTLPNWHGVNVAQGFREPATYYLYTGDKDMLEATYNDFNIMRQLYGQVPGGMYGADENARSGYFDPRQGTETCAIVEQMASDEILMGITGDTFWADHCENVAFNTLPAAFTQDMKALRYLTSPNMTISDEKLHGPSIDNNLRGMLSMSPFSSRCCQHNHGMGWPYFAEHLVMATADGGLATMLYAANIATAKVAEGQTVILNEQTHYPFDESVEITLNMASSTEFPLYLRIPSWATEAGVTVNGENCSIQNAAGKYVCVKRQWNDGDKVCLTFPMKLTQQVWQQNKASVSLDYGPLTLSLKLNETYEQHDSRDTDFVQDDSHWQEGVDASLWPCYVLKTTDEWNYALEVDSAKCPTTFSVEKKAWPENDMPFTPQSVPLEFTVVGHKIPSWGFDSTGMTDLLPTKYAERSAEATTLKLIPMGAARLRISAFPTYEK